MRSTIVAKSVGVLFALFVTAHTCNTALAQQNESATLDRAVQLFEQGEYLQAQEGLVGIDRAKLNAAQQQIRDDYLNRTQVAITMSEKALRNLEDAETAIAEDEREQAAELLEAVLANQYAPEAVQRAAGAALRAIREQAQINADAQTETPPSDMDATVQETEAPTQLPTEVTSPINMERARLLVHEAGQMTRAGRYEDAAQAYEEALGLVPGFPEAIDGLSTLQKHLENANGHKVDSLIARIRRQDAINWQRSVAEYRDVENTIRESVAANHFTEANQTLARARQIVESSKQFAHPVTLYESLADETNALSDWVSQKERVYNEESVARIRRDIEEQRSERLRQVESRRKEQVDALMEQAIQHRKDGDLDAAVNVLSQVVVIDPRYTPARWMLDTLEDLRQYRKGREIRDEFYKQSRSALIDVEESKIPWYQELNYPKNWAEITSRPERNPGSRSGANSQLISALNRPVDINFPKNAFEQVIERFVDNHRLNISVDWYDLKHCGVERTAPIALSFPREITLKKALTEVLQQAGGGVCELGYSVAEGVIKIASQPTLDRNTYTAVYDINDLLMEIPMFRDSPMTDLTEANRRARQPRSQQADRPWQYGDDDDDEPEEDPQRAGRVQQIINMIQDNVAPMSWRDRGGSVGAIQEFNGQLVVTQNSAAQRQLGDLLSKLREQRAIQIAIEARFITVSSHYLEELGIDIDIVLNSGNAGFDFTGATDPVLGNALLLPRAFSRLGFVPAAPVGFGNALALNPGATQLPQPFGQPALVPQASSGSGSSGTPIPIINNVTAFTNPSSLGSDIPGSFAGSTIGPAFSLFGSFLDNIQVDFLIRATQADSRTSVLTAPRLVLFNGQRSWVAVTIQQNFVSQLNPVVATGAVAQAPQIGVIDSGAVLDVAATVSADRRYVTMTLRPGVTRLLALQTIPFSGGGAGGGFGVGAASAAFIQLPTLSAQRVQTTVSVPDGGTLLIGGQKLASETEVEAGVPILSKIPILKRLYSSRSMVKDEQTLLILIKPKILIHSEQEELAFPSFSGG